ncbi:ABC transporter ATP-binding protein [Propioniciclava sp. MC1595]|uniref:ABC transporter ATP-binding protein n=1 Tax=Propioniciclava sp. MC1595 TaxID=2760308 RepID=UPI001662207A|nr:ABC transporter ATP-binding protein [Propioniciclava sp. MC1595]MBB1496392.1 ABC transporter ATP-binding protein [Propioniciclava sp. MC1595]QTE24780.1 ABC transporter ATP-binding protein [Propioniciclava sp. MC1595]
MSLYEVENLTRVYSSGPRRVVALDDVSLTVERGQRLGIVGESGSGKSTLIRLMASLDRPTSGEVRFDGRVVSGVPERRLGFLRASVQLVLQDPRSSLNPRMNVGDIVAEPLRSPIIRRERGDLDPRARVAEVLDAVGLPVDAARRYPHEFSGGQRQRIAIARALAPSPEVLIADEAVSALDVSVRAQVLNLLMGLVDELSLTLLFVSHDLAVVRHVCPDAVVMQAGRIVEAGPTQRLFSEPEHPYTARLVAAIPTFRARP